MHTRRELAQRVRQQIHDNHNGGVKPPKRARCSHHVHFHQIPRRKLQEVRVGEGGGGGGAGGDERGVKVDACGGVVG